MATLICPRRDEAIAQPNGKATLRMQNYLEDLQIVTASATETTVGVVKMATTVAAVASADASGAPGAYSQTQVQELVTLANELKAQVNSLLAAIKTAGQMTA